MESYLKKNEKEFIKYIKKNPFCTREEWDNYAKNNGLYSANTLRAHLITEETEDLIKKTNTDSFNFIKEMYIIIPSKPIHLFKKIKEYNQKAKNEQN